MPKDLERALTRVANRLARQGKLKARGKYKTLREAKQAFVWGNPKMKAWVKEHR